MDRDDRCEIAFIEACLAVYVCIPALDYAKTSAPAAFFPVINKLIRSFLFASILI